MRLESSYVYVFANGAGGAGRDPKLRTPPPSPLVVPLGPKKCESSRDRET